MDRKEIKKKKKKFSEHDPEKHINLEPSTNDSYFREATGVTAVVSFGRFNPITVGHEKLVNKVISEALRRKATPMVFMSHSQDPKKNPLSYEDKINYGRKAFGRAVIKSKSRTIIEVAKELTGKFDNFVLVVGQDRIKEFEALLNKYNGKEFNFNSIEVVSAGARDPDSEGVEGMSASKMRSLAQEDNFEEFQKGLPRKLKSSAREIYSMVRSGMNLSEEHLEERAQLSVSQRRRRGMVMKRYKTKIAAARKRARRRKANPEKLKKRAQRKAIEVIRQRLSKNKSYKEMSPTEKIALDKRLARVPQSVLNRIATRQLPKVKRAESERLARVLSPKKEDLDSDFETFIVEREDPDVGNRKGSQPKDYYKGVAKSVKDDRARHFEKHSKMNDDNPAAYKKAPGDEGAKTKTSKHTKRFKQIFGEASCADTRVRKRPHMALEKNGTVKFDKRFKMYRSKNEINENAEELNEELVNLVIDLDSFVMSEEFDVLMESDPKEALKKKAEKSGISYGILKKVFDRGVAAWRTGHRPGTNPTQWGLARVNSFATKGKGTWGKADSDLAAKVRKEEVESPTAVKPFVQTGNPDKAAKVSSSLKHKLGVGLSMKHMLQHGIKAVDKDNDGDVDAFEKGTPDEITGAEKKNLTKVMQKKLAGEVKHSKIGHAFESVSEIAFTLDEMFEMRNLDEASIIDKALEKIHKYVIQGTELGDIAYQISRAAGVNLSGKELENKYTEKYGKPQVARVSASRASAIKKKYGFSEAEVNENEQTERVKERIRAEKERDKMKHDRMLDRAKMKDLSTKLKSEGSKDPSDREWGTDSLTKTYKKDTPGESLKEESPLTKHLPRGTRVSFTYKTMTGPSENVVGTVVGAWQDDDNFAAKQRLRVRDDNGKLYTIKHEDVEIVK